MTSPAVVAEEPPRRYEVADVLRGHAHGLRLTAVCCVASPVAGLVAVKMAEAVCRWSPTWEGGVFRSGASL